MAIELCSDNSNNYSTGISPRISFSHDLCLSAIVPVDQHSHGSNSIGSIDFDFCTRKSFDQDSSSADELFSNGKILPTEIKKKITTKQINDQSIHQQHSSSSEDDTSTSSTINNSWKKEKTKEITKSASDRRHHHNYQQEDQDQVVEENKQNNSKSSFWRFKRSSSLKCVSGYGRSLCPLPLLSRSNSTGSAVPNNHNNNNSVKRVPFAKDSSSNYNHKHHKQAFFKSQSSSSSSTTTITSHHQKPPLKKNYGSYGNASVRVNPVLNVPSGNLFGLSSIFSKEKIKKK